MKALNFEELSRQGINPELGWRCFVIFGVLVKMDVVKGMLLLL